MPFDPISYQLAKKAAARSVISYDRDGDGFIEYIATRKYETMPAVGAQYELAIDNADGYLKAFNPADNTWRRVSYAPLNGYSGFDNAGGGAWHNYINIPVTTIPSEYAQYRVVINGGTVEVYSVDGILKASGSGLDSFWTYVRSNGLDIRVFDQAKSQLYFWTEEWDYINQKATIWVNLTAGGTELNIAYGNPSALKSSYENGEQVFEFFDDFEDGVIDEKWDVSNLGSVVEENGYLEIDPNTNTWNNMDSAAIASSYISANFIAEAYLEYIGRPNDLAQIYLMLEGPDGYVYAGIGDPWEAYNPEFRADINGDSYKSGQNTRPESGTCKITIKRVDGLVEIYENDNLRKSGTFTGDFTTLKLVNTRYQTYNWKTARWHYIKILKLADPADFGTPVILSFD